MKRIAVIFCFAMSLTGCDKGFDSLNLDPNSLLAENFNPAYVLSTAQLLTVNGDEATNVSYTSCFVQHLSSLSDLGIHTFQGDKYVYLEDANDVLWNMTYGGTQESRPAKLIEDILQLTKDKPEYHNLYQMSRIWKTILYHRLTDLYGDIPYFEASLGYYGRVYKPGYDKQKDIYQHMLAELEDAVVKLDGAKPSFGSSDLAYGGDVAKWKKLGCSMMLRLGMRLSKVDPDAARIWVSKAYKGGVIGSNEENLLIRSTDTKGSISNLTNGTSFFLRVGASTAGKISKTFFDYLKKNDDPRLPYTVAVYPNPADVESEITDPQLQKGMPNGYNRITLESYDGFDPGNPAKEHQFSGVRRDIYAKLDGVRMLITYPEMQFLLAEAALRGWIAADARELYDQGVYGAMKLLKYYDVSADISDQQITTYLARHPFVGEANLEAAMEQINTQFWAATFLNGYEAFANFRRSGYPRLVPVNYPENATGGKMPSRLRYPQNEMVLNGESYHKAVAGQGPDLFTTKVWWDQ